MPVPWRDVVDDNYSRNEGRRHAYSVGLVRSRGRRATPSWP